LHINYNFSFRQSIFDSSPTNNLLTKPRPFQQSAAYTLSSSIYIAHYTRNKSKIINLLSKYATRISPTQKRTMELQRKNITLGTNNFLMPEKAKKQPNQSQKKNKRSCDIMPFAMTAINFHYKAIS